jgi:transcriptional regulator with XRE-family HTH domain
MMTWKQRVLDLKALGYTFKAIADLVGTNPSTISDLAYGNTESPTGDTAVNLHQLHAKLCTPSRRRASVQPSA